MATKPNAKAGRARPKPSNRDSAAHTSSLSRPGAPTGAGRSRLIILTGIVVVAIVAIVFVALVVRDDSTATSAPLEPLGGPDPGVEHVHGLGVDPKDGMLYAATHTGVFRIPEEGNAVRVANRYQDTMGFIVTGSGVFLGSGHPDQREGLPDQLGLIESTDRGRTWRSMSLAGRADFHALEYKHNTVYGYESSTARFMVSEDKKSWDNRAVVPTADFAVSPADGDVVVATTEDGLARSTDGARTFTPITSTTVMYLVSWPATDTLFGITPDGATHVSADGGGTWQGRGRVDGQPQALTAVDAQTVYVATATGIHASNDGGRTFQLRHSSR